MSRQILGLVAGTLCAAFLCNCDGASTGSNPSSGADRVDPSLVPLTGRVLTDSGSSRRIGDTLVVLTRNVPKWSCDGDLRVRDSGEGVETNRILLDGSGNLVRSQDVDTFPGGSIVVSTYDYTKSATTPNFWIMTETNTFPKTFPADSARIASSKIIQITGALELLPDGTTRIYLVSANYAAAFRESLKPRLPSWIAFEVVSTTALRMANSSTGEVATLAFQSSTAGIAIDWTSSNPARPHVRTGDEPATCPQESIPSWLNAFLSK